MAEQEIRLQDIFDMDFIQKFQDDFARAVGMTAVTVDLDGTPVTHPTDWTDFCMKYTRGCPKGKARCEKCDADNGAKAAREGRPQVYECHAGLMDFAAPIMLNGKQVGSILGGQVLTQPLDEEKYRRVAQEIGVDPDEYIAAARKIQVVDRTRLDHAAQTLYLFAGAFSKMGYYQHRLRQLLHKPHGMHHKPRQKSRNRPAEGVVPSDQDPAQHRLYREQHVSQAEQQLLYFPRHPHPFLPASADSLRRYWHKRSVNRLLHMRDESQQRDPDLSDSIVPAVRRVQGAA